MNLATIFIIAVPLAALQFALMVVALRDLTKPTRNVRGNSTVWLLVVLFVQFLGPLLYLLFGRRSEEKGS